MDTKNIELYQKGNMLIGYEKGGPSLDSTLKSVVIGNKNGERKRALFVNEGSKENIFAGIPVTINDIVIFVSCDVDYNIIIEVSRITGINTNNTGRIYASCNVIDRYSNDTWSSEIQDD